MWYRVIIVSALSLSLRDKELRERVEKEIELDNIVNQLESQEYLEVCKGEERLTRSQSSLFKILFYFLFPKCI